ncbi:MAG: ATPase domain-containing protein [Thermoprotei archaeon]
MVFRFGVKGLDELYGEVLVEKSAVVIAGHPGTGKTILATTMCYSNALNGYKCLYITVQEDKEKIYRVFRNFNVDLNELEAEGLLKIVKLPLTTKFSETASWIMDLVGKYKPNILVIDSISALLRGEDPATLRGWFQNFFYELSKNVNGLVVLIAEIPVGSETIGISDIEFVADILIILKYRIKRGLMARFMEFRKIRGFGTPLVEIPFTITSGKGIVAYPPPILAEIPPEKGFLKIPCKSLDLPGLDINMGSGKVVTISYDPQARPTEILPLTMLFAAYNSKKVLFISYRISPSSLRKNHY